MIGKVIWIDGDACRAIIRCENRNDLVLWAGNDTRLTRESSLQLGDVLQFDICVGSDCWQAHNVQIMQAVTGGHSNCISKPRLAEDTSEARTAKIIPFDVKGTAHHQITKSVNRK